MMAPSSRIGVDERTRNFEQLGQLDHEGLLAKLSDLGASVRREDRANLIGAFIDQMIALSVAATHNPAGPDAARLVAIGAAFPLLSIGSIAQQQLCCDVAMQLGLRGRHAGDALCKAVMRPLLNALMTILRIGGPAARHNGVEALGAILRFFPDTAVDFPGAVYTGEPNRDRHPEIDILYVRRRERQRLMALAVAGDGASRAAYLDAVSRPISPHESPEALDERSELLSALPAILCEESPDPKLMRLRTGILMASGFAEWADANVAPNILAAFGRYQETLFRTVRAMIRRGALAADFDAIVARAVEGIPGTTVGPLVVSHAQVRATVAILCTAVMVVRSVAKSTTKDALRPFFHSLLDVSPWFNAGIAEGCFRALPSLLSKAAHNDLSRPALEALFEHLASCDDFGDFARTHRQHLAYDCFRRLLIAVAERDDDLPKTEHNLRLLLQNPEARQVLNVFQRRAVSINPIRPTTVRRKVNEIIIGAAARETLWLRGSEATFAAWSDFDVVGKLLVVRTLAVYLRGAAESARVASPNDVLRRLSAEISTISLSDDERMTLLWHVLSAIPSEAAHAADADLQDFVENSGGREPAVEAGQLPGFVLAMVSGFVSDQIADVIAREIDLAYRRGRLRDPAFDLAGLLYQVMLRGSDKAIFDHLLPRLSEERERDTVRLFRNHITTLQRDPTGTVDPERLLAHIEQIVIDLLNTTSPLLEKLREALKLYGQLYSDREDVWRSILRGESRGGLDSLFHRLDELAETTHGESRRPLAATYAEPTAFLQSQVERYLELPIDRFDARADALTRAAELARQLETEFEVHEGLQPPESTLLIALMQRLRRLFERTIQWYCDEPRRLRELPDADLFWFSFARHSRSQGAEMDAVDAPLDSMTQLAQEPPPYPDQVQRFERFFVEWMSSEFETDSLRRALRSRWSRWFVALYVAITNPWLVGSAILIPYLIAATFHYRGLHSLEGVGFFVLFGAATLAMLLSFAPRLRVRPNLSRSDGRALTAYQFECLYPRMAGLIAAPMVLTIEFEHSYSFPMYASTSVVLMLMCVAVLTTHAVITRATVGNYFFVTAAERRKVWNVVALALAHSFAIAMFLSLIFVESHMRASEQERGRSRHEFATFLGVPREIVFDPRDAAKSVGRVLPVPLRSMGTFTFYPAIILTWTAFGLFVGIVLEGSLKGHLRRETS
jgi:hypothetical protein